MSEKTKEADDEQLSQVAGSDQALAELAKFLTEARRVEGVGPTTAEEFVGTLSKLYAAGMRFDEHVPPRVVPSLSRNPDVAPTETEVDAMVSEFARATPKLPQELVAIIGHALNGQGLDVDIVGSSEESARKLQAVRDLVLTDEFLDGFALRYTSKIPTFKAVDWEVGVKTAERGWTGPLIPYAEVAIKCVEYLHGEDSTSLLTFGVSPAGLDSLIADLEKVRDELAKARRMARKLESLPE